MKVILKRSSRASGSSEPLTRERWTAAATEVLVDSGIDHVRVDALAAQLSVTRGSFYHHFRDREDLLRAVLRSWQEHATESLTAKLAAASPDPIERLFDVLNLPFHGRTAQRAANIELGIRAWARRDSMAREVVDQADAVRIHHITSQFEALGYTPEVARLRAGLLYGYNVAQSLIPELQTKVNRRFRLASIVRLLTE